MSRRDKATTIALLYKAQGKLLTLAGPLVVHRNRIKCATAYHPQHNCRHLQQALAVHIILTHHSPVMTEALDWPQASISQHPVHVSEEVCCSAGQRVQVLTP